MTTENSAATDALWEELKEQSKKQDELLTLLRGQNEREAPSAEEKEFTFDVKSLLLSLWRYLWLIILCTAIGTGVSYFACYRNYTPTYTATAKMYVNNDSVMIGATKVSITSGDLSAAQSLVQTYCEILKTHLTLDEVGRQLEQEYGYKGLNYHKLIGKIKCGSVNETEIFYISITDTDPARAIHIANMIVDVLPGQIETVIDGSSAKPVDKAEDAAKNNPGFTRKIMLGAVAGALLACAYAFLRGCVFNDIVENDEWLRDNYAGVPILAQIPDINASHGKGKYGYSHYSHYSSYDSYDPDRKENKP